MLGFKKDPALDKEDDLSGHTQRQLFGYIGLLLPGLLVLMVIARDGMTPWRSLDSISAYYYTGAVAAFVGMLVSWSLFLFTYRGYNNKYHWADRLVGIIAAVAALGVAVFPTAAPSGVSPLSWWQPMTGVLHYACAVALFAMYAIYALLLFPLTPNGNKVSLSYRGRNWVFVLCGGLIVVSMIWAAFFAGRSIFLPESIATVAFAVSWLAKGKADATIGSTVGPTARSVIRRVKSVIGRPVQTSGRSGRAGAQ